MVKEKGQMKGNVVEMEEKKEDRLTEVYAVQVLESTTPSITKSPMVVPKFTWQLDACMKTRQDVL